MTASVAEGLAARIAAVLAIDPSAGAIESQGSWCSWGQLAETADQVAARIERPGTEVGVVLRNRPASVATILGVLQAGGCVVTINPGRGADRTREDLAALDLPLVIGEPDDLAEMLP